MKKNVIAFMNMKGGVGKTTICVNLAGCLANKGYRVLIVDMDPQMNTTQYLLEASEIQRVLSDDSTGGKTIYCLYRSLTEDNLYGMDGDDNTESDEIQSEDIIYRNIRTNLDLICGDLRMTNITDNDGTVTDILNLYIMNSKIKEAYDFIFIDCPPTQSIYTTSAFKAANFYLLIIKPDYLSTIGLSLFENIIKKFNSRRTQDEKIKNLGIISNLNHRNNEYHNEKLRDIREKYKFQTVFESSILMNNSIAKASEAHTLMYEKNGCKRSIEKLTLEFLEVYKNAVEK